MIAARRKALAGVEIAETEASYLVDRMQAKHERERAVWLLELAAQQGALQREREAAGRSRTVWLRTLVGERNRRDREIAEQRRLLGVWLHGLAAGYRADADATPSKPKTGPLTDDERRVIAHELEVCARDLTGMDIP